MEAASVKVDEEDVGRERLAQVERMLLEADNIRCGRLVDLPGGGAGGLLVRILYTRDRWPPTRGRLSGGGADGRVR